MDSEKEYDVVWSGSMPSPYGGHTKGELLSCYPTRRSHWLFVTVNEEEETKKKKKGRKRGNTPRTVLRAQLEGKKPSDH